MNAQETARLKELLAECLARVEDEGEAALDALSRAHPEFEGKARASLATLRSFGFLVPARRDEEFPARLGPFRLVRRLGRGGMGVVYLAEQEPWGREVALKLVRPDQLYFPGARERFRREIEAIARLQHPGIARLHVVGEAHGIPYFAMQRVPGEPLASILERVSARRPGSLIGGELAPAENAGRAWSRQAWPHAAFHLIQQVAHALAHAHSRGVLHRDVKPSNIMVTPDQRAILVDFGLASTRGTTRITQTGSQLGSLHYMAPEQLRGDRDAIDERTDVYALGVVLHELLTLRSPFRSDDAEELRRRISRGDRAGTRTLNPTVSPDAETVCRKAMDVDPSRRYPSMIDFARDLENVLRGRPIEAERPSVLARALRIAKRAARVAVGVSRIAVRDRS